MAKIKHTSHIEEILGAHEKGGMTERRKHFHDYDGNVTKVGEITYNKNVGIFDEFDGEYSYVGIRSADGACYLEQIVFGWTELSNMIQ